MSRKNLIPIFKRSAFLLLLLIAIYYVRRDLPAVLSRPELAQGLAIFFLVALAGLFFALAYQVHKEKLLLQRKLGAETYNWLTKEN